MQRSLCSTKIYEDKGNCSSSFKRYFLISICTWWFFIFKIWYPCLVLVVKNTWRRKCFLSIPSCWITIMNQLLTFWHISPQSFFYSPHICTWLRLYQIHDLVYFLETLCKVRTDANLLPSLLPQWISGLHGAVMRSTSFFVGMPSVFFTLH